MTTIDFMIFEDEKSQIELIRRSILYNFPQADIHTEENPYAVFHTISLFKPRILIVDYQFETIKITEEKAIMNRIFKFKGLVIIYSAHDIRIIKQDIRERYGMIPANFRILSKSDPRGLINEVKRYNEKRGKGLDHTLCSINK